MVFIKKRKTPYVTCFLCGKLYHDPEEELMHRISVVPKGAEKIWSKLVGKDLKPGSKLCQVHFEKDAFATNVEKNPYVKGPPKKAVVPPWSQVFHESKLSKKLILLAMEVPGSGKPDYFCSTITTHPLVVLKRGVKILVFKSDKMSYTFMKTGCELSVIEELIGDLKKSLTLVDPRDEESFINYYTINEESFQSLIGRQPARESCEFLEIVSATESRQQEEMVVEPVKQVAGPSGSLTKEGNVAKKRKQQ